MSTSLAVPTSEDIERVLVTGDLSKLTADQKLSYYNRMCESLGLNPLTKPFQYITLNGKLTLYATKDCTEQLRKAHSVSVRIVGREVTEGCYVVTAQASMPNGRQDESLGAVPIERLVGEARANALMKCETKAKRRVTLSICGLGMLDESEFDSIPGAYFGGSKDAQTEVRDRKLAEIRAAKDAIPPAGPALPPATIIEMANELEKPMEGLRPVSEVAKDIPIDKPTAKEIKIRQSFRELKTKLKTLTGDDNLYYDTLKVGGYNKSSEVGDDKQGRDTWKAMASIVKRKEEDEKLRKEIEGMALTIGPTRYSDIMGANGWSDLDEFLVNANGDQTNVLIRDLRQAVQLEKEPPF